MVEEPACSPEGPRNIVLLSDGTGNSAAKTLRTNVWRMYEAVDLSTGSQLALYDNGVGTSMFRPLAILGGAFGWGLKRNVRDLYVFACRNYRAATKDVPADRIYAMGFSRGAFTIRVLVDLIGSQGLITGVTGRELERRAKWAYREYRRQFNSRLGLVNIFRWIRDVVLRVIERKDRYRSQDNDRNVTVTFMGLWDTVDAYGLPMDEMTRGWDQWVWPLKMDSSAPPKHVTKICHAIALDDERHTFHPVLLDEDGLEEHDHTDKERVTQVWFSGVHSNVGGGYPDDSLSHVSLRWMAAEACKKGLKLHKVFLDAWAARCDPHGPAYDSRRGLSSYYRYHPRGIARLTDDDFAHVTIKRPKIHCSVFQRVTAGRDEYAPIVLPERYAVVTDTGSVVESDPAFGETRAQAARRASAQERVWDRVWVRRVLYFATVITTLLVVVPPLILDKDSGGILPFPWRSRGLEGVIGLLGSMVPATLQSGVEYYREQPFQLVIPVVLILVLMRASTVIQRGAADRMRALWTTTGTTVTPPSALTRFRTSTIYRGVGQVLAQHIFPFVFGLAAFAVVVVAVTGTVNRGVFALASAGGAVCRVPDPAAPGASRVERVLSMQTRTFPNDDPCFFTGLQLESGVAYRATFKILGTPDKHGVIANPGQWWDNRQVVKSPEGFSSGENPFVLFFLPFRRVLSAQWFVPVIRIGDRTAELHLLNTGSVEFTPRVAGPLFLFVNDAIGPGPLWKYFYENNDKGLAEVTITRMVDTAPAAVVQTN